MTKTGNMFVVGLLFLFFAAAGNAVAASGPSPSNGATWSGDIISIVTAGVVTISPNTFGISSRAESVDLERSVKTARGAPMSCAPAQPPCKAGPRVGPNKG